MAFNKAPSAIWPGCSFDGTVFKIPLSVLGITGDEAMDWREFLRALLVDQAAYVAALPGNDQPKALVTREPVLIPQISLFGLGEARLTFELLFYVSYDTETFTGEA